MSDNNQVFTCPAGSRHFFKDMRAKSKSAGPPWRFFMRCAKCTAMLCQIVSETADKQGNVMPKTTAWIITAHGSTVGLESKTRPATPKETAAV